MAITVVSVFIWISFLLVDAPTRTRIGAAEQSNASCSASGFAKQGRILLTGDFADQIFDCHCKQHSAVYPPDVAAIARQDLRLDGNYTAIQRLVLSQDAICREPFKRAIATAFTQFAHEIRRFDQRIQASSSRGYIAERIQRTTISYDFWNATDPKGDDRFSIEHRLKNA